jgi:hypothetical protein
MTTETPKRSLDELAAELEAVAKRAKAATADAALTAELTAMGADAQTATPPVAQAMSVLYDCTQISLTASEVSELERRRGWLGDQLTAVLGQFHEDPTKIRRGPLWRDTKRAIEHLRQELFRLRDEHYQTLLAEYPDDDAEHLRSLPPHTTGLDEYTRAIDAFERTLASPPHNCADVERAVAEGERLRDYRAQVESAAVPDEFRTQWRKLRGAGLSLHEFTSEFHDWLSERGIDDDVVLRLRTG